MNPLRLFSAALAFLLLCACAGAKTELKDGYYTAEAASFDAHGWKEFVTIYVSNDRIVTVEYDAKNASGFIKSWDMDYMRIMNATDGTYPNKYTRDYSEALLSKQNPARVDAVSGASHSYTTFQILSTSAVAQAVAGDRRVAFVEIPVAVADHTGD